MAVVLKGKGLEKEELETPAEYCFPPSTQTARFPHQEKVLPGTEEIVVAIKAPLWTPRGHKL